MTETHTTDHHHHEGGGNGALIAIVVVIAVVALFLIFGLPSFRRGTNVNIPDQIDVDVNNPR